jgi:anti-sigma B factor antagonist
MAPLELDLTKDGAGATVSLRGELDTSNAQSVREVLEQLRREGVTEITLDLEHLAFMDSTGLAVFLGAMKRLRGAGGDIVLSKPNERITRTLVITGLDRAFRIIDLSD